MKKAVVVPSKGSTGRYAARMVIVLIEECGDGDRAMIVKSDQEPVMKFLVDVQDGCQDNRAGAQGVEGSQRHRREVGPVSRERARLCAECTQGALRV